MMAISSAEIQKRVKITNLFRLGKRLENNETNKELFLQFEKNYTETKDLLTSLDRKLLEETFERLKKKYSIPNQSESEQLFGNRKTDAIDQDFSQHEIEKQILELARNMKQVAGNFSSTLKQDSSLLESIHSKQTTYITELEREQKRLQTIQVKTNFFALFKSFFASIFSFILFIIMLIVIHLFPSTTYISIQPQE